MQFEVETETVITETEEAPAEKPNQKSGALKRVGIATAKVAGVIALILAALAVLAGIYLLLGWVLVLLVSVMTGGTLALSALQGAAVLLTLNLVFGSVSVARS